MADGSEALKLPSLTVNQRLITFFAHYISPIFLMMSFIIPSVQEMFNLAGFVCIPSQPVPCRALREWILEVREVKSEMEIWFTHFENEK